MTAIVGRCSKFHGEARVARLAVNVTCLGTKLAVETLREPLDTIHKIAKQFAPRSTNTRRNCRPITSSKAGALANMFGERGEVLPGVGGLDLL